RSRQLSARGRGRCESRVVLRSATTAPLQDLDDRLGSGGGGVDSLKARHNVAGHRVDALPARGVLAKRSDRLARVAADANLRIDLNFADERHAKAARHHLPFAVAENVDTAIAMRAVEVTHVFN